MQRPRRICRCVAFVYLLTQFAWFFAPPALATPLQSDPQAEALSLLIKINGQHPPNDFLFTSSGPALLTLDIAPGEVAEPLDFYLGVQFEGQGFWLTSRGPSLVPLPLARFTPFAVQNLPVLSVQLNGGDLITFLAVFARGNTIVAYSVLTAVGLPSP